MYYKYVIATIYDIYEYSVFTKNEHKILDYIKYKMLTSYPNKKEDLRCILQKKK